MRHSHNATVRSVLEWYPQRKMCATSNLLSDLLGSRADRRLRCSGLDMTNRSYYKVVAVVCQSTRLPIREPMVRLFGQKLQYLRRSKQLTQAQLAAQLGTVTQSYISHLEAGRKEPSIEFVLMVADAFNISLDYLLRDTISVDGSEKYIFHNTEEHSS